MPDTEMVLRCTPMRVLVTGGTGFLGSALVPRLRADGHQVRILARSSRVNPAGVEFVAGSVLDRASLANAVSGCTAIVHLVGIISECGSQTYERVHTEGTRNLLDAAGSAGAVRWLQVSAIGARPDAPSRYLSSKGRAEALVRSSPHAWTILRPSLIYGPGDGFTNLFAQMSRWSPVLPLMGGGHTRVQPIEVSDVIGCLSNALIRPVAIGQTYDLCGADRLTWREVLTEILRARHRRRWLMPIPWSIARAQARFLEVIYPLLLRRAPPLNRDQLRMLAEDNVGDPGPAREDLGLIPRPFRLA